MANRGIFDFLNLPYELRRMIYDLIYDPVNFVTPPCRGKRIKCRVNGQPICPAHSRPHYNRVNGRLIFRAHDRGAKRLIRKADHLKMIRWSGVKDRAGSLLFTNRQIYAEALQHLIRLNEINFGTMRDLYIFLAHVHALDPDNLNRLHRFVLGRASGPYSIHALELLNRCTSVETLRISICTRCYFMRTPRKILNKWKSLPARIQPFRPRWCDMVVFDPSAPPPDNVLRAHCYDCIELPRWPIRPIASQQRDVQIEVVREWGSCIASRVTIL